MSQLEGFVDSGLPTLAQWVKEKKITQNLYNNLTKDDPPYTVELLLLMPQNHLMNLKSDLGSNVRMPEILQLINLLKKIPQSQVYQDSNKQKQVIYLTPQQHETINKLKQDLTNISLKIENIRKSIEKM